MTVMNPMLNTPKYLKAGGCFKAECPTLPVAVGATEFGMSRREFFLSSAETCGSKARGYPEVGEGGNSAAGNLFMRATDGMRRGAAR